MATLLAITNRTFPAGSIVANQSVTLPAGVVAFTYTITIGDPALDPPTPENATAWIDYFDGVVWRELSRYVAGCSGISTGRVDLRGSRLRLSASCSQTTTASLSVETSA
jgi:hypothetical protein